MDLIYSIDKYVCAVIRKLYLSSNVRFSRNHALHRYFLREYCKREDKDSYHYPNELKQGKTVWLFWAQGENAMPPLVLQCYHSILVNRGNYDVVLLDLNNYKNYVTFPDYIERKRSETKITLTHFSDILRFALLEKFGGWWIDITIFLTQPLPVMDALFTVKLKKDTHYISESMWSAYLWYLPQGHPLAKFMSDYWKFYWNDNDVLVDYFLIDQIVRVFYTKSEVFKSEIDHLSVSNPNIYFFQSFYCEQPYQENDWDVICSNTQFFKNNWRKTMLTNVDGEETYFGHIFNEIK